MKNLGFITLLIAITFSTASAQVADSAAKANVEKLFEDLANEKYLAGDSAKVYANQGYELINATDSETDSVIRIKKLHYSIELLARATAFNRTAILSYKNIAVAWFKLEVPDSAMAYLDIVRSMYPQHPELHEDYYNVGVMYYFSKRYPEAIRAWRISLKLKPGYETPTNALAQLKKEGVSDKNFKVVLPEYTRTRAFDSDYVFYNGRGNLKSYYKDHTGAIADYTKAIDRNNKFELLYFNRGHERMLIDDYAGAIVDFDTAIRLDPSYKAAYLLRAEAKRYVKDHKGAVDDYTSAIISDPEFAAAYCARGLLNIELGKQKWGCTDLAKAKELGDARAADLMKQHCR